MFYIGITVKQRLTHYYGQFALSLGKGSLDFRRLLKMRAHFPEQRLVIELRGKALTFSVNSSRLIRTPR